MSKRTLPGVRAATFDGACFREALAETFRILKTHVSGKAPDTQVEDKILARNHRFLQLSLLQDTQHFAWEEFILSLCSLAKLSA